MLHLYLLHQLHRFTLEQDIVVRNSTDHQSPSTSETDHSFSPDEAPGNVHMTQVCISSRQPRHKRGPVRPARAFRAGPISVATIALTASPREIAPIARRLVG